MADTNFTDYVTPVPAAWLNDINDHVYNSTPVSPAVTVHPASQIANTPAGGVVATTVQAAINELDTEKLAVAAVGTSVPSPTGTGASGTWGISITGNAATATSSTTSADAQAHIADTVAAHAASAISNTPAGGIAATDVQAAINELDTGKTSNASAAITGGTINGATIGGTTPATGRFTTLRADNNIGVGATAITSMGVRIASTAVLSGSAVQYGFYSVPTFGRDGTASCAGLHVGPSTEAAAYTLSTLVGVRAGGFTKGAGSTVTNYYAFYADAETDATNNYGAYIDGNSAFGGNVSSTYKLRAQGNTSDSVEYSFGAFNLAAAGLLTARNDGQIGTGTAATSPYNNTTASAANVFVTSGGILQRSTSSIRFKSGVEDMEQQYAEALVYQSRPVYYRSTCEADNPLHSYWGFIAEELALIDPRVVQWGKPMHTVVKDVERERFVRDAAGNKVLDAEGRPTKETYIEQVEVTETNEAAELIPDGVAYERFVVALVKVAQEQKARIEALEARLVAAGI